MQESSNGTMIREEHTTSKTSLIWSHRLCSDGRKGSLSLRNLGFALEVMNITCYYWAADVTQQYFLYYLKKKLVKPCMMLDQWVLCTSVERFYFWHIGNVVGVFLPFFPWNVQRAHNACSNLISLFIPTIIKKMLKLHLSAQRNLWWREVGFFLNLLLCRLVCSWIGWLAE